MGKEIEADIDPTTAAPPRHRGQPRVWLRSLRPVQCLDPLVPHRSPALGEQLQEINPQVRGWFNYYGAFYRSELYSLAQRIDQHLVRWAMHKFKRLRGNPRRAWAWLVAVRQREPALFAHWQLVSQSPRWPVGARGAERCTPGSARAGG